MFPEHVETESLDLRPFTTAAVDPFELYDLFSARSEDAAEVFEYVPQEPYDTVRDPHEQLEEGASKWEDGERAHYAVFTTEGALAGSAALIPEWDRKSGRLGAILGRPYWGEGYAVECAIALTELAFDRLDLELVGIGHEAGNDRSKRAIEKFVDTVGGQYDGVLRNWTPIDDEVADHHRYTVSREQFQQAREDGHRSSWDSHRSP